MEDSSGSNSNAKVRPCDGSVKGDEKKGRGERREVTPCENLDQHRSQATTRQWRCHPATKPHAVASIQTISGVRDCGSRREKNENPILKVHLRPILQEQGDDLILTMATGNVQQ